MPEFTVLSSDDSAVCQRKVARAVRVELSNPDIQSIHTVFSMPALMSMHIPIACEMLDQLQNDSQARVSLALAGNGVVIDLLLHRRQSDDGTHFVYVIHSTERMRIYTPEDPPVLSNIKRARECSPDTSPATRSSTSRRV